MSAPRRLLDALLLILLLFSIASPIAQAVAGARNTGLVDKAGLLTYRGWAGLRGSGLEEYVLREIVVPGGEAFDPAVARFFWERVVAEKWFNGYYHGLVFDELVPGDKRYYNAFFHDIIAEGYRRYVLGDPSAEPLVGREAFNYYLYLLFAELVPGNRSGGFYYRAVLEDLVLYDVWGYGDILDYVVNHAPALRSFYAPALLSLALEKAGGESVFKPSGWRPSGGFESLGSAKGRLEITVTSINGTPLNGLAEIRSMGGGGGEAVEGIPWAAPSREQRLIVTVASQYDRLDYPVPLRINFTDIGEAGHVDGASLQVYIYDPERAVNRLAEYSAVEVAPNTYWFVVKANLSSTSKTYIVIYYNYGGAYTPGVYYGGYPVRFPLPVDPGNGYEQAHAQLDNSVPKTSSYGDNMYLLLLAPKGYLLPIDDTENGTGHWLSDDDYYWSSLPFTYLSFTSLAIGSNGIVSPVRGITDWSDTLSELIGYPALAVHWNDLRDYSGYTVYEYTGTWHGLVYKTWYWKTGYYSNGYDGHVRFRLYLMEDGLIGIHYYSFVSGTSWAGGFTTGISDSRGRWICPISSSSGHYSIFPNETSTLSYDMVYVKLDTLSYNVTLGGRGYFRREGPIYKPLVNGTLSAELAPGTYIVVFKAGVYGYVWGVTVDAATTTSLSLVAYPVTIGFKDSSGGGIGFLATEIYSGSSPGYAEYLDTVTMNATGYYSTYFLEGTYLLHPLLLASGNPYLELDISPYDTYPATRTWMLNVSKLTIVFHANVSRGAYNVTIRNYYTGEIVKQLQVPGDTGEATAYLPPGRYTVEAETYSPLIYGGAVKDMDAAELGLSHTVAVELGEESLVEFTLATATIDTGGAPILFHIYRVVELPGYTGLEDMGHIASGHPYPLPAGNYMLVPDTVEAAGCGDGWELNISIGDIDAVYTYSRAGDLGSATINAVNNGSAVKGLLVELVGDTGCGTIYYTWATGYPLAAPPGTYIYYLPTTLMDPGEAGSITIEAGAGAEANVSVGLLTVRVLGHDDQPLPYAELWIYRETGGDYSPAKPLYTGADGRASTYLYPGNYTIVLYGYMARYTWSNIRVWANETRLVLLLDEANETGYRMGLLRIILGDGAEAGAIAIDEIRVYREINGERGGLAAFIDLTAPHGPLELELPPATYMVEAYAAGEPIYTLHNITVDEGGEANATIPLVYLHVTVRNGPLGVAGAPVFVESGGRVLGVWVTGETGDVYVAGVPATYTVYTFTTEGEDFSSATIDASTPGETYNATLSLNAGVLHIVVRHGDTGIPGVTVSVSGYVVETNDAGEAYVAVYPGNYTVLLPYNTVTPRTVEVGAGDIVDVVYELSMLRVESPLPQGIEAGQVYARITISGPAGDYQVVKSLDAGGGYAVFYLENASYTITIYTSEWSRSYTVEVEGDTGYTAPLALIAARIHTAYPVDTFDVVFTGEVEARRTIYGLGVNETATVYLVAPPGTYSVRIAGLFYGDTVNVAGYGDSQGPYTLGPGDTVAAVFNMSGVGIVGNASCGAIRIYVYYDNSLHYYRSINTSRGETYIGLTRGYYVFELPNGARSNVIYVDGLHIVTLTCYNVTVRLQGPRGEPVAGARIIIRSNEDITVFTGYTGPDGSVSLALLNGTYRVILPGSQYLYNPYDASIDKYSLLGYGAEYTITVPTLNNTYTYTLHRIDVYTLSGGRPVEDILVVLYTSDGYIIGGRISGGDGHAVFYATPGVYRLYIRGAGYARDSYRYLGIDEYSYMAGGGAYIGLADVSGDNANTTIVYNDLSELHVNAVLLDGSQLSYSYTAKYGTGSGYDAFSQASAANETILYVTPGTYRVELTPPGLSPTYIHTYTVPGATVFNDTFVFEAVNVTLYIPSYPGTYYTSATVRLYAGYTGPGSPGTLLFERGLVNATTYTVYLETGRVYAVVVPGTDSDSTSMSNGYGRGYAAVVNATGGEARASIVFRMSIVVFNITSAEGPVSGFAAGLVVPGHGSRYAYTGSSGLAYMLVTNGSYGVSLPSIYSGVLDTISVEEPVYIYSYRLGLAYVTLRAPEGLVYGNNPATLYLVDEHDVVVSEKTISLGTTTTLWLAVNHTYTLRLSNQYGPVEPVTVNTSGEPVSVEIELGALVSIIADTWGEPLSGCTSGCSRVVYAETSGGNIYLYTLTGYNASLALAEGTYLIVYGDNVYGGRDYVEVSVARGNITWHTYRLALINVSVSASITHEPIENASIEIYSLDLERVVATGSTNSTGLYAAMLYGGSYRIRVATPGGTVVREAEITAERGVVNNVSFEIEYADVAVAEATYTPTSPSDGDTVYVYVTITNHGPSHITHDFTVKLYINNTLASTATIHGLLAGANATTILTATARAGLMMMRIVVDEEQTFFDENRSNNVYAFNVSVEKPDLEVTGVSITPPPRDADNAVVAVNVTNNGPGGVHRDILVEIRVGDRAAVRVIHGLEPGDTYTVSASIPMSSGDNEVTVTVDPRDEIREVREDNNVYETIYHVPYVDLEVEITGFNYTELVEGEVAEITYVVRDRGYGTARAFYVTIYVDGEPVYTDIVYGINEGGEETRVYLHEIMGGSHNITIVADPDNRVPENDTGNNAASITYTAPSPDITLGAVTPNKLVLDYGEPLIVNFTVVNTGYTTHRTFYARIYVDGEYYNITVFFSGIEANASKTSILYATRIPAGNHTVTIVLDEEGRIHESNEDNNAYSFNITVLASDLEARITYINATEPEAGDTVAIEVNVTNHGPGSAEKPFYVALFLNGEYVEQRRINGLGVGESTILVFTLEIGAGVNNITVIADDHYERMIAGYTVHGHHHEIGDPDRGNNRAEILVHGKAPDYTVTYIDVEEGVAAWGQPLVTVGVKNTGSVEGRGNIVIRISVPGIGFSNNYVYALRKPLEPGETVEITIPRRYSPPLPPGTWTITVILDPYNHVLEEREDNNALSTTTTIDYPDLAVVEVTATPSTGVLEEGDPVNLTITVANYGNTVLAPFCLRVVDSAGRALLRIPMINMTRGSTVTIKETINITPPGGSNYYVAIDYFNDIPESNEDNNIYQLTLPLVKSVDIVYPTLRLWYNRSNDEKLVIVNNGGVDTTLNYIGFNVSWITASYSPGTVVEAGERLEIPLTIDTLAAGPGSHVVEATIKIDGATYRRTMTIAIMVPEETVHGLEDLPSNSSTVVGDEGSIRLGLTWPPEYNVSLILSGNASSFFTKTIYNLSGGHIEDLELGYSIGGAEPGTYVLYIAVYSPELGVIVNRSMIIRVEPRIELEVMAPGNNTEISTAALTIIFETRPETNATIYVTDTSSNETIVIHDPVRRRHHVYRLGGLSYHRTYRITIAVSSKYMDMVSKPYYVTINPAAAAFTTHTVNVTVTRDYNQKITLVAVNNDPYYSHRIQAYIVNPYDDLIADFIGPGSRDQPISLGPGESAVLTLAIHAQDAEHSNYTIYAVLLDLDTGRRDIALVNIRLRQHVFNVTIKHLWTNNYTLVSAYMITNHGDTITDLKILLTGPMASYSYIYPAVNHGMLRTGESIIIYVVPSIPAMPDAAWKNQQNSLTTGMVMITDGLGNAVAAPASAEPPPGTKPYGVNRPGAELRGEANDWYCTNRPDVTTTIPISHDPPVGSYEAYLLIDFHPHSGVRPHDVNIYVNGHLVDSLRNTTPTGTLVVEIPYEYLGLDPSGGITYVTVRLETRHMNGGHYIVATHFRIIIKINKPTPFYVFAHSYEEAIGLFTAKHRLGILAGILANNTEQEPFNPTKKPKDEKCTQEKLREEFEKIRKINIPGTPKLSFEKSYDDWKIGLELSATYTGSITGSDTAKLTYGGEGKLVIEVSSVKVELGGGFKVTKEYKADYEKCTYECAQKTYEIKVYPSTITYKIGPDKLLRIANKIPYVGKIIDRVRKWVKKYVEVEASIEVSVKDITINIKEDCKTGERTTAVAFGLITTKISGVIKADDVLEAEVYAQGTYGIRAANKHLYLDITGEIGAKGTVKFWKFSHEFSVTWSPGNATFPIYNDPLGLFATVYSVTENLAAEAFGRALAEAIRGPGVLDTNTTEYDESLVTYIGYDKSVLGVGALVDGMENASVVDYDVAVADGEAYVVAAEALDDNSSRISVYAIGVDGWRRLGGYVVDGAVVSVSASGRGDSLAITYAVANIDPGGRNATELLDLLSTCNTVYYIGFNISSRVFSQPITVASNTTREAVAAYSGGSPRVYWVVADNETDYIAAVSIGGGGVADLVEASLTQGRIAEIIDVEGYGFLAITYINASGEPATLLSLYDSSGTLRAKTVLPATIVSAAAAADGTRGAYVVAADGAGAMYLVWLGDAVSVEAVRGVYGYPEAALLLGDGYLAVAYTEPSTERWPDKDIWVAVLDPADASLEYMAPAATGPGFLERDAALITINDTPYLLFERSLVDDNMSDNTAYGYTLVYAELGGPVVEDIALSTDQPYTRALMRVTIDNPLNKSYTGVLVVERNGSVIYRGTIYLPANTTVKAEFETVTPPGGAYRYYAYLANLTPSTIPLHGGRIETIQVKPLLEPLEPLGANVYNASEIPVAAQVSPGEMNATVTIAVVNGPESMVAAIYNVTGPSMINDTLDLGGIVENDTYIYLIMGVVRRDGTVSSRNLTVAVDVNPPRIEMLGHGNGSAVAGYVEARFAAVDVFLDPYATRIYLNGTPAAYTIETGGGGYAEYVVGVNTTLYRDGKPLVFTVVARDRSGKTSIARYILVPYNSAPHIEASVANGSIVGERATIRLNITGSYLDTITVYVNDTLAYTGPASPRGNVSITFPGEGYYLVRITVNNTLGKTSVYTALVYSDQSPPTLSIGLPSRYASTSLTVHVDAWDRAGVAGLYYRVDDGAWISLGGESGDYVINITGLEEGAHTLSIKAVDPFGHASLSHEEFIVDKTPPRLANISLGNYTYVRGVIEISYEASDPYLYETRIYLNDTLLAVNETSIALNTTELPDGVYVLRVAATDLAGNTAIETRVFTVDNTPPLAEILGVENNTVIRGNKVTLTLRYYDKNLERVVLIVDNETRILFSYIEKTITLSLDPGTHTITLSATDKAGNTRNTTIIITTLPGNETRPGEVAPAPETPLIPYILAAAITLILLIRRRNTRHHYL